MNRNSSVYKFVVCTIGTFVCSGVMYVTLELGWWFCFGVSSVATLVFYVFASKWLEAIIQNFGERLKDKKDGNTQ